MKLAQQNADHSGGTVLNAGSCFGGWKLLEPIWSARVLKGKQFCSLAVATSPAGRLLSLFWPQINSVRAKQSFFHGWLASIKTRSWLENKTFFLGRRNNGAACQESWGWAGRTDIRTLIWFRLKKWFFLSILKFCAKLYHHLKSRGCSAKSFPGCCCKLIFCPLVAGCAFWGRRRVVGGSEADAKFGSAVTELGTLPLTEPDQLTL